MDLHQIQSPNRKVLANVVGGGWHIQVTLLTGDVKASHVRRLPRRVKGEGLVMEEGEGGDEVVLKVPVDKDQGEGSEEVGVGVGGGGEVGEEGGGPFRILKELLGGRRGSRDGLLLKSGNEGDERRNGEEEFDVDDAEGCAHRFGGDPLKVKRCECSMAESNKDKVFCYASLVASGIKLMRRLKLDGVASEMKHEAQSCAIQEKGEGEGENEEEMKIECFKKVVGKLFKAVEESKGLSRRIKAEIDDSDNASTSSFSDRDIGSVRKDGMLGLPGMGIVVIVLWLIGAAVFVVVREGRRRSSDGSANGLTGRLSSALNMVSQIVDDRGRRKRRTRMGDAKVMKD